MQEFERGFTFIQPDNPAFAVRSRNRLFCHVTENPGLRQCKGGERINFCLQWQPRRGTYKAIRGQCYRAPSECQDSNIIYPSEDYEKKLSEREPLGEKKKQDRSEMRRALRNKSAGANGSPCVHGLQPNCTTNASSSSLQALPTSLPSIAKDAFPQAPIPKPLGDKIPEPPVCSRRTNEIDWKRIWTRIDVPVSYFVHKNGMRSECLPHGTVYSVEF